ncbi:MAG: Tiorf63 protein [Thermoplasmatales archaeon I-plasma]|jgi:hypothetical protein|nr:MAG: Tiorf63 protein [Thermoplasmatales archaeon I-plasma]
MKSTFLSYGGGVQTFCLLLLAEEGKISRLDELVFADTGAEHPETYEHLEKVVKPICKKMKIKFVTVRMKKIVSDISRLNPEETLEYKKMFENTKKLSRNKRTIKRREEEQKMKIPRVMVTSLRDTIVKRRIVPSVNPSSRWCTSISKLVPIQQYIVSSKKNGEYVEQPIALIGLSADEMDRIYKPHHSEYVVKYPLIGLKMTRQDCIVYIRQRGYSVPPKSGCYFCPFQSKTQWVKLMRKHQDLFDDAIKLEEADLNFPTYGLRPAGGTLREIRGRWKDQSWFAVNGKDEGEEMACEQAGYCGL